MRCERVYKERIIMAGTFCAYCGEKVNLSDERCSHCNAPMKRGRIDRADPYFANGYVIYAIRDWSRDDYEFIFYKGSILQGRIRIARSVIDKIDQQCDWTPTIMEYFNKTQPAACPGCGRLVKDGTIYN